MPFLNIVLVILLKYLLKKITAIIIEMENLKIKNKEGEQFSRPFFVKVKVAPQIRVINTNANSAFQTFKLKNLSIKKTKLSSFEQKMVVLVFYI